MLRSWHGPGPIDPNRPRTALRTPDSSVESGAGPRLDVAMLQLRLLEKPERSVGDDEAVILRHGEVVRPGRAVDPRPRSALAERAKSARDVAALERPLGQAASAAREDGAGDAPAERARPGPP